MSEEIGFIFIKLVWPRFTKQEIGSSLLDSIFKQYSNKSFTSDYMIKPKGELQSNGFVRFEMELFDLIECLVNFIYLDYLN